VDILLKLKFDSGNNDFISGNLKKMFLELNSLYAGIQHEVKQKGVR